MPECWRCLFVSVARGFSSCGGATKHPPCRHGPSNGRQHDETNCEQQHTNDDHDPQRHLEQGQRNAAESRDDPGCQRGEDLFGRVQEAGNEVGGVGGPGAGRALGAGLGAMV